MDSGPGPWTIRVTRTHQALATNAAFARGWRARMVGLLGRRELPAGEGLVFERCRAIHTVGMRFAIDLVFFDRAWRVVGLRAEVVPGRFAGPVPAAWGVIELPAGSLAEAGVRVGDQLEVVLTKLLASDRLGSTVGSLTTEGHRSSFLRKIRHGWWRTLRCAWGRGQTYGDVGAQSFGSFCCAGHWQEGAARTDGRAAVKGGSAFLSPYKQRHIKCM